MPLPDRAPSPPTSIRPATDADIPRIRAILTAHGNDGPIAAGGADIVGPYIQHLVRRHRTLVAADGETVVAFGAVVDTGRAGMLGDLFVVPDRLGQGIGRPLLDALFEGFEARATFASDDPRALPLYVRAGMTPLWPSLYVEGDAARLPDPVPVLTTRNATPEELAVLEEAWNGDGRASDHAFWASNPGADPFLIEDEEGPAAFGYARAKQASTARALDRLLVRPGADPVPAIMSALARAARGGRVQAVIPGPNPSLPVLLRHGFHVVDRDLFLASDPELLDPVRLLPNPGML